MKNEVDPLGILSLNLLSLGYALTPELVGLTRHLDKRPFPFFALYAVEDNQVIGQVGGIPESQLPRHLFHPAR